MTTQRINFISDYKYLIFEPLFSIVSERVVNNPIGKVFNAFADPNLLARWWGPHGFTNRFEKFEFFPGGHWVFDMIDENGKAYFNHAMFMEIIPDARISWTRLSQPIFNMEIRFVALDHDRTRFSFLMSMPDERIYNTFMTFAPQKNEENFDRLEEVLRFTA